MPTNADFFTAAAAPLVVITAWEALFDRARLQPGQTVLIHAGAGGVGHVAIQAALQHGARVATTVSTTDKADFVTRLGVEKVIDYTQSSVVDEVDEWTNGKGADVIFDTVGGSVFAESMQYAAEYGKLVTLLEPQGEVNWKLARGKNMSIMFELMLTPMLRNLPASRQRQIEILDEAARMMEAGQLQIVVGRQFSLAEAAAAHRLLESGHTQGKIVLDTTEN